MMGGSFGAPNNSFNVERKRELVSCESAGDICWDEVRHDDYHWRINWETLVYAAGNSATRRLLLFESH
jgi:hypothetical protein